MSNGVWDQIEFSVGQTVYGQPLRLICRRDTAGQKVWELHREAGNQRDDKVFISGLTPEVIRRMAEAVKST